MYLTRRTFWYKLIPNMASISAIVALETFRRKGIKFIDKTQTSRLFGIEKANTAYKFLQRLKRKGIIKRVTAGLYVLAENGAPDFEIANAACASSYVSLESALSYYGILSQFPYVITSVTTRKSKKFTFAKEFEYTHLSQKLYWGFVKDKEFVIATPEKALWDMLYLSTKGLRKLDIDELETSLVNQSLLSQYCQQAGKKAVTKILKQKNII